MAEIASYQAMVAEWQKRNFGPEGLNTLSELTVVSGFNEEVGELNRAICKMSEGIRGSKEEWMNELRSEAADVLIRLLGLCDLYDFSLENALAQKWAIISQRDWVKDPQGHGIESE